MRFPPIENIEIPLVAVLLASGHWRIFLHHFLFAVSCPFLSILASAHLDIIQVSRGKKQIELKLKFLCQEPDFLSSREVILGRIFLSKTIFI